MHVVFYRLNAPPEFMHDVVNGSIALTQCYTCHDSVGVVINAVQAIRLSEIMGRVWVGGYHQPPHDGNKFSGL